MIDRNILDIMEEIDIKRFKFIVGLTIFASNHKLNNENELLLINKEISSQLILTFQKRLTEDVIDHTVDYLSLDLVSSFKTLDTNKKVMWVMYINAIDTNSAFIERIVQNTESIYRIK